MGRTIEALIVFGLIWNEIGIPTLFGYGVFITFDTITIIFQ